MGDVVDVNCKGKGRWYRAEVIKVKTVGEYQVKYEDASIKWVTNTAVKGTGETNK